MARMASAPPRASTLCLTRSFGAWANTGCVWLVASNSAADNISAYFMQFSLVRKVRLIRSLGSDGCCRAIQPDCDGFVTKIPRQPGGRHPGLSGLTSSFVTVQSKNAEFMVEAGRIEQEID